MRLRNAVLLALLAGGIAFSALPAWAETLKFAAELKGTNESPVNTASANGHADVTYDTDSGVLTWDVTYSGLSGPAIGAHIHGPADPGNNAGIMIPFPHLESPMQGSAKLAADQAKSLLAGLMYVNVHTKANPGGEIRGQLLKM